ncbi:MAG: acyl-CoA dehydrogenase family protein [Acidobacteriia bacterium]|nr:acyl-CoA dehydrogenase family protein [Terriglobia bacterium]
MEFAFSKEQMKFRNSVASFAERELNHNLQAREQSSVFPRDLWNKCADFGIQGLALPKEYGGRGADALTTMLAMEALGYGCLDQGLLFSMHAQMWSVQAPILKFGTDEQRHQYLPRLCDGSYIAAHCMSEPGSGSDSFSLETRAKRKGGSYVLNGSKAFVTNGPFADLLLVFATVNRKNGLWGITAFLVDAKTNKGLIRGPKGEKLGLCTAQMGEVRLEDCEIPAQNILGKEGQGGAIFNYAMGLERSYILASTVGRMHRQLEECIDYSKTRRQFGKPIASFQLVSTRLVDMKLRLETSRLLLYRTAWLHSSDGVTAMDAAMAKLYISECAVQSALDAIQIHGARGISKDCQVERDLRDAVAARIYSGTSEIQRLMIARGLGLFVT